jgi:hypothetical protein
MTKKSDGLNGETKFFRILTKTFINEPKMIQKPASNLLKILKKLPEIRGGHM